jgi:hypothetical protein
VFRHTNGRSIPTSQYRCAAATTASSATFLRPTGDWNVDRWRCLS